MSEYTNGYTDAVTASAALLNITRADMSLMVGEMKAQEWRTVCAVLMVVQRRINTLHDIKRDVV